MFHITSKLELNLTVKSVLDLQGLSTFIIKNRIPALVVDPKLLDIALIERSKINARYKVITGVDFNSIKRYAIDKFLDLPKSVFESDGVEILLSPNKNDKESLNEIKSIMDYVNRLNPLMEIRWVFSFRTKGHESYSNFMKYLPNYPAKFLRTDPNLESAGITTETHQKDTDLLKKHCNLPIKVSGNITLDMIKTLKGVSRFDVDISQAKRIVKILTSEPPIEPKEESPEAPLQEPIKFSQPKAPQPSKPVSKSLPFKSCSKKVNEHEEKIK